MKNNRKSPIKEKHFGIQDNRLMSELINY